MQNYYFPTEDYKTSSYVGKTSPADYNIHNSEFFDLHNRAICISSDSYQTRLLSHQCTFTKCSYSSYKGGSIYFGTRGACALIKVCATEALNTGSDNGGIFSYQEVSKEDSPINLIDLSTIFNCGVSNSGNNMIGFVNGNVTLSNTNESRNLASTDPFYQVDNAIEAQVKFCEFENSTSSYHTMAIDWSRETLNSCNVVKCKLTNIQGVIYLFNSQVTLTNCAILQHESSVYFYIIKISYLTLIKCAIDCDSTGFDTQGSPSNKFNTNLLGKSSFINTMSLLEYQTCLNKDFYKVQNKACMSDNFLHYTYISTSYASAFISR